MSTKWKFSRRVSGLLAAAVAGLVLATGGAAAEGEVRSVAVRYGDLDLSREAGVRVLYGRLQAAAESVCGRDELRDLRRHQSWLECRDAALARAVDALGNARLAALHRERPTRQS